MKDKNSVFNYGIKSILCAPLRFREKIFGTIYIDDRTTEGHFTEEDKAFLICFANMAAISYENARVLEQARGQVQRLEQEVKKKYSFDNIIGTSQAMHSIFRKLESIIAADVNVLLEGESGTGKELVAQAIHYHSSRKAQPFIPVNCGALPDSLIESELFGHKKGAFTGAFIDKKGLFEAADQGTLFLDEISNTSLLFQAKLLRVLQEGELRRVGDSVSRKVNVRVIAASNRNLRKAVEEGLFREDLYYRLNVIGLSLPPLRERKEEIPLLAEHFLKIYGKKTGISTPKISKTALESMMSHDWPGNVRELENCIQKGIVLARGNEIQPEHLELPQQTRISLTHAAGSLQEARDRFEGEYLRKILQEQKGNVSKTAKILEISRPQIHRLLLKHGLQSADFKADS